MCAQVVASGRIRVAPVSRVPWMPTQNVRRKRRCGCSVRDVAVDTKETIAVLKGGSLGIHTPRHMGEVLFK